MFSIIKRGAIRSLEHFWWLYLAIGGGGALSAGFQWWYAAWFAGASILLVLIGNCCAIVIEDSRRVRFLASTDDVKCENITTIIFSDARTGKIVGKPQAKFYKLRIESVGGIIHGCFGTLIKIEKDGQVKTQISLKLPFTPSESADSENKSMPVGAHQYLDVMVALESNFAKPMTKNHILPNSEDWQNMFQEHGRYLLTVIVSGDEAASLECIIGFDWTGVWDKAHIELLQSKQL